MTRAGTFRAALVACCAGAVAALAAQSGSVRVTAARANVRADASETGTVLTQVTSGTLLTLIAVQGDWFQIQLPPDPRLGGARVNAYISKKVAKLEAAPESAGAGSSAGAPPPAGRGATAPAGRNTAAPPGSSAPAAAAAAPGARDGMSVALVAGDASSWMTPGTARTIQVSQAPQADRGGTIAKLAAGLTTIAGMPAPADPAAAVTYVWVVDSPSSARALDEHRPSFVVQFKDVPGVNPDDIIPVLVRIAPVGSEGRVVAALRGRADQESRLEADWDVFRDLKQDIVRSDTQTMARGTVRIQPSADLPPGEYAVVLRLLNPKRKLSGATLLHNDGEGRAFGVVWDFAIK